MNKRIKSKVKGWALVTGGSSGIGRELCIQLSQAKIKVIIADINKEAGEKLEKQINNSKKGKAHFVNLNVRDQEGYSSFIKSFEKEIGKIDLLINNAGIGTGGEIIDMEPEDWDQIMGVNFFGVINGINNIYPKMIKRKRGTIVNVASVAGLFPLPAEAAYSASKYAVVGLTKVLEIEAKNYGINTILICPGKIETPIYQTSEVKGFDKEKALTLWPKGISPKKCAKQIIKAIATNKSILVITPLAKALSSIERISPFVGKNLGRIYLNKMRKYRV